MWRRCVLGQRPRPLQSGAAGTDTRERAVGTSTTPWARACAEPAARPPRRPAAPDAAHRRPHAHAGDRRTRLRHGPARPAQHLLPAAGDAGRLGDRIDRLRPDRRRHVVRRDPGRGPDLQFSPGPAARCAVERVSAAAVFCIVLYLMENMRTLMAQLQEQALSDGLTGLANRRAFGEIAARDRPQPRFDHQVSLAYIDIDDFKGTNDRLGHEAGDRMLIALASLALATARSVDTVARIGGDEFAIIMPETGADAALPLVTRIREAFPRSPGRARSQRPAASAWRRSLTPPTPSKSCLRRPTRSCTKPRRRAGTGFATRSFTPARMTPHRAGCSVLADLARLRPPPFSVPIDSLLASSPTPWRGDAAPSSRPAWPRSPRRARAARPVRPRPGDRRRA